MKKLIKVCLIAGIICVFIGGGITAAAAVMGGAMAFGNYEKSYLWSGHWLDRADYWLDRADDWTDIEEHVEHKLKFADQVETQMGWGEPEFDDETLNVSEREKKLFSDVWKMDLETGVGIIQITEGDTGGDVQVMFEDDTVYNCYMEGNTLKIKLDKGMKYHNLKFDDYKGNIKIIIPKDYTFKEVELELGAGVLQVDKINADSLELDVKTGDLRIYGGKTGTLSVDCSTGSVYCRTDVSGEVEAECKAGSIELLLTGEEEDYNYELKCRAGSLKVADTSYAGLNEEKKINNKAGKKMELECSAGEILVDFES